jgi:carboxymethylenebutenolidase
LEQLRCNKRCGAKDAYLGIFLFHPTIPNYPKAKFPGVVVFSEIYQGELLLMSCHPSSKHHLISQLVTGPVARFARQIASQGYIVAAPSSYHEFTGPEALAYDGPGTDKGNEWKITKKVEAYDEDAKLSVDTLLDLSTCNGRIGATGKSKPFIFHHVNNQSLLQCVDT